MFGAVRYFGLSDISRGMAHGGHFAPTGDQACSDYTTSSPSSDIALIVGTFQIGKQEQEAVSLAFEAVEFHLLTFSRVDDHSLNVGQQMLNRGGVVCESNHLSFLPESCQMSLNRRWKAS